MSKKEELTKELKEMFEKEFAEADESHVKIAENHEEIMQMIEEAEKK